MDERQKRLVKSYGFRFLARYSDISTQCLHLCADACSVLTDAEWKNAAEAMTKFIEEMNKVEAIVSKRAEEATSGNDEFISLYSEAKSQIIRFH